VLLVKDYDPLSPGQRGQRVFPDLPAPEGARRGAAREANKRNLTHSLVIGNSFLLFLEGRVGGALPYRHYKSND